MKVWIAALSLTAVLVGCQLAPPSSGPTQQPQGRQQQPPKSEREAVEQELSDKRTERDQIVAEMKSWEAKPDSTEKQDRLAVLDNMKKQVENDIFRLEMRLRDMGGKPPAQQPGPTAQNQPKQDDTDAALDQALEDAQQSDQAMAQKPREQPKEEPLPVPKEQPKERPKETPLVNQAGRYDPALPFEDRWADVILRVKKALEKYSE